MSLEMASGCEGFPQQSHGHVGGLSAQCSQLIITAICLKLLLMVDRLNPTSPNSTISDSVYQKITNVKIFGTVSEIYSPKSGDCLKKSQNNNTNRKTSIAPT